MQRRGAAAEQRQIHVVVGAVVVPVHQTGLGRQLCLLHQRRESTRCQLLGGMFPQQRFYSAAQRVQTVRAAAGTRGHRCAAEQAGAGSGAGF